jgi:hypothetical protein
MSASSLQLGTSFGVSNVIIPKGGPKVVGAQLDFTVNSQIEIDGLSVVQNGRIEFIQGMFIDNSDNPSPLTFIMQGTFQRIVAPAHSQGYYSILLPNPPQMVANTTPAAGLVISIIFYNVPIQSQVWKTA